LHGQKGGTVSTSLSNPRQEIASRNSHLSQSPRRKHVMDCKLQPEDTALELNYLWCVEPVSWDDLPTTVGGGRHNPGCWAWFSTFWRTAD
jgi:hypothetical protein